MIGRTRGSWITAVTVLAAFAGSAWLAGCGGGKIATRTEETIPPGTASKAQLIAELKSRMEGVYTLTAKAHVEMVDQAEERDGRFPTTEVNGQLLLKRAPDGKRQVRFSAQTLFPPANFTFLGRNEDFWILMPDFAKNPARDGKEGTVYIGKAPRDELRSRESFSYRPQDLADVFLVDEVFDRTAIVYMETWKPYYILHFLRPDRPENIYSKIWINRISGDMSVHQIFDRSGVLLVEGRFRDYQERKSEAGEFSVRLPTKFSVIWPRDKLVLNGELDNLKLNNQVRDQAFDPVLPRKYRIFKLRGEDEAPSDSADDRSPSSPPLGD